MTSTRIGFLLLASLIEFGGSRATIADQPAKVDEEQTDFTLNPKLIEQARKAAAKEAANTHDSKQRRPEGLNDLESPEAIQRAVKQAMQLMASSKGYDAKFALAHKQLSYVGAHAFDALVKGAKSDDLLTSGRCCDLLKRRGSKAVAPLCEMLKTGSRKQLDVAARALGEIQDPAAVLPLIEALNDRRTDSNLFWVAKALMSIKDQRAVEPLRKAGKQFESQLDQLQKPDNFRPWPPEQLPVRQLCHDAATLDGESFGEKEIIAIAELIDSPVPQVRLEVTEALTVLRRPSLVPQAIKSKNYRLLAHIPTPEAFNVLVEALQSPQKSERQNAAAAVGHVGRWGVPLLVGMLDDSAQLETNLVSTHRYAERYERTNMPNEHFIHRLLFDDLGMLAMRGRTINVRTSQERVSVQEDISRAKAWWEKHGNDFLDGKDVPNPNLTRHNNPAPK